MHVCATVSAFTFCSKEYKQMQWLHTVNQSSVSCPQSIMLLEQRLQAIPTMQCHAHT